MGFPWTEQLSQGETIAAAGIPPQNATAATYLTAAVDMVKFRKVLFIVYTGTIGGSATIDFSITASATSGGSYTAVTGTSITQITASNKAGFCEISADFLESVQGYGFRYIKGSLVVGTATSQVTVVALGACPGYSEPASNFADASLVTTNVLGA